jgi:Holliday junction DNA helicase RuvA
MIASLNGRVQEVLDDSVVIEVGGVGVQVYAPAPTRDRLHTGDSLFLYTYLVVREESLTLYGFESREGREFFQLMLSVNGMGPRLSLNMLSTLSPDAIRRAVFNEQAEVFSRVPGVGRKTAQKILLHLQDRLPVGVNFQAAGAITDFDTEVLGALTALGYSIVEAQAALQAIPRDAPQDVESRLRLALQYFSS